MNDRNADPIFAELRPRLVRLAYRMLGSLADAEDVVQNAWLRWSSSDREAIREPSAWLCTVVTRLSLNEMKSARRRRKTYPGPWLPEPMIDPEGPDSLDDLTLTLMVALERLTPLERAAFLLHDVFGMRFDEIAGVVRREPATCRKLASRARRHVRDARPRFPVSKEEGLEIAAAFYEASRNGELERLRSLLADGVTACADGGGNVPATPRILAGVAEVLERHRQLAPEFRRSPSRLVRYVLIDGLPGFVTVEEGGVVQTTALQVDQGKIVAIFVTRNPEKLRRLAGLGEIQLSAPPSV